MQWSTFPLPWLELEGLLDELEGLLEEELGLLEEELGRLEEGGVEPSQLRTKTQSLYSLSGDHAQ